ncbi:unnamed protein product [Cunninghamella echinulata]
MTQLTTFGKRPPFLSFPIPFDYPFTIPTLIATSASALLLYYYLQASHAHDLVEALRKKDIKKRRYLKRPEDKFASLKIEKHFVNPFEEWEEVSFLETALFWLRRWKGNGIPKSEEELEKVLPVKLPELDKIFSYQTNHIKENQPLGISDTDSCWSNNNDNKNTMATTSLHHQSPIPHEVTFTWFGQSTCLITIDGLAVLTDPVFTKCSINDYLGPKRVRPIPCPLKDFQSNLDIVLVSHDHFDHLDEKVVHQLGNSVTWYIPLGLREWFLKRNVDNVVELDWWQEIRHHSRPDIVIACVPAMHWSGSRTPFEKNTALWCSYVIKGQHNRVFFCGDTGYSDELFQSIGELYAPFTLAAIPIGSFEPVSMMQHVHMGPQDALKVHDDLKSPRLSVGIHWGTFMMSDEHYLAPSKLLAELWNKRQQQQQKGSLFSTATSSTSSNNDLSSLTSSSNSPSNLHDDSCTCDNYSTTSSSNSSIVSTPSTMSIYNKSQNASQFITTAFGETIILN